MLVPPNTVATDMLAELAVRHRAFGDLAGEFAGRGEDEHTAMRRQDTLVRLDQALDRRQHERRGLAGAGLRDAEQIAALEHGRDRLLLDRGRRGVALGLERADERLGEAEMCENLVMEFFSNMPRARQDGARAAGGK